MCGLTGFWQASGVREDDAKTLVLEMARAIAHRGPDDHGAWVDGTAGIALGHRRLSIVDLSAAGHQPMASTGGRYVIAFNGEIYNHLAIRRELEGRAGGITWRGHSDTETLLAAVEAWGFVETLRRTIGMFAIALWDREDQTLSLARDRLGEKPLYYGWQGNGERRTLVFGSELKALRVHPAFDAPVDREALTLYMRTGYIPAPWSIHSGIQKLPPASYVVVHRGNETAQVQQYWSAEQVALDGYAQPLQLTPETAVDRLEALLGDAVQQQMVADVPLGAFLSGGIDSSTIVALMQSRSDKPIKTFSIGFHEAGYNEAEHAAAVARHLRTEHTELYVRAEDALSVVPALPQMYDEPFADSSQIPTHLVSKMAREHVTVALSGDAGDELFCGYSRYLFTEKLWSRMSRVPRPLRQFAGSMLSVVPAQAWNSLGRLTGYGPLGERMRKGANALGSAEPDHLYLHTISQWLEPELLVEGVREPATLLTGGPSALRSLPPVPRMMAYDIQTYLPGDILTKVDRAAMSVSLETRVPMLDHRVVEFASQLPMDLKLRNGTSKWVLREVLYRHVPRQLIERPKMGFGIPLDHWLRGPLRDWAEQLLSPAKLRQEGLRVEPIRHAWQEHVTGARNRQYALWTVLSYMAWKQNIESKI